jgi:tetratricopeptide (TPR) repeat protein
MVLVMCACLVSGCTPSALVRADRLRAQADDLCAQSRYREAVELGVEELRLREDALGPGHPDVADAANQLGLLLRAVDRHEEARALFERALRIWVRAHGQEHVSVTVALNNLATLEADAGRYEETIGLLRRASEVTERALGPEHPEMIGVLCNLAHAHLLLGEYRAALPLLARAQRLFEANPKAEDKSFYGNILSGLAQVYQNLGDLVQARVLFDKAIEHARRGPTPDSEHVLWYTRDLGNLSMVPTASSARPRSCTSVPVPFWSASGGPNTPTWHW